MTSGDAPTTAFSPIALRANGLSPDIIQEARLKTSLDLLVDVSERAYAPGVFGVPTFIVGSELYFGNDRLDFAIEAFSEKLAADIGLQLRG